MKEETILDVLLFLFENYFYDDPDAVRDRDSLQAGLIQAGFSPTEISKAFDRAMALDQDEEDLDDLKWVVLMVLFTQPGAEAAFAWMESQMFGDDPEPSH